MIAVPQCCSEEAHSTDGEQCQSAAVRRLAVQMRNRKEQKHAAVNGKGREGLRKLWHNLLGAYLSVASDMKPIGLPKSECDASCRRLGQSPRGPAIAL
eukprot:242006-Chlamydomonas_euryale.AAC.2